MSLNRREFIKTGGLSAAALAFYSGAAEDAPSRSPNEKLNVAYAGSNGRGAANLGEISKLGTNVVALCDVDPNRLGAKDTHTKAKTYTDWRKMLEQKDIDAVVVSTPDHCHAPIAMAAMRLGKHVYVEKPMCHSVYEARAMTEAARQYKVASQMGNHGTASAYIRRQAEWVQSGVIGAVKEVHVWTDRPGGWWAQGIERPTNSKPMPAGMDWDVWLGPAPERPYHQAYHPHNWRGFWDFGTGALGDMGCHIMNFPFYALRMPQPISVECTKSGKGTSETPPKWTTIEYKFPAANDKPAMTMTWYDGGGKEAPNVPPKPEGVQKWPPNDGGTIYVGEKGTIYVPYMAAPALIGQPDYRGPEKKTIPDSKGHHVEFVEACKGNAPAGANFDYAGPLTEIVLLGNLAVRVPQKKLEWDSKNLKVTNAPEAAQYVKREYRKGWSL